MKRFLSLFLALVVAVGICFSAPMTIEASAADVSGDSIVAYARTFLDSKYQYVSGGTGPTNFDCIGFVKYVFAHFGISLPDARSTSDIWNNPTKYGTIVGSSSIANAHAGDVISWSGHVAIYTENGYCIHALNSNVDITEKYKVSSLKADSYDITKYNVIRIYGVGGTTPTPSLKTPVITFDKSSYTMGDTIKIAWALSPSNSNLSHYWISVADPAGNFVINQRIDKSQTTFSFATPGVGTYTVTMHATPYGSVSGEGSMSDTKSITINPKVTKPSNVKLTASATSIPVNGSITFNASATNATSYFIGIDKDGKRIHEQYINGSFTYKCTSAGSYSAYFTAYNSVGYTDSPKVYWTVYNNYAVKYDANGGTGAPATQTKYHGTNLTLSSTKPTKQGYTFKGWGATANDTVVRYAPGATYTANSNVTLYAIWERKTYTVKYDANGGTGAPAPQTKMHGTDLVLSRELPTKDGFIFRGWEHVSSSGTTIIYTPGSSYLTNADITLYAIWMKDTWFITYDANGGYNAPGVQGNSVGFSINITNNIPKRTGYDFQCWVYKDGSDTITYYPGQECRFNEDVTLYAQWKCNHTLNGTTIVNAKDPTYTEEGYTGDTKCNTCEEIIKTGSAISKVVLGVPAVKATNTTNGVNLTWNAIDGATSYKIFRKKLTGTTWTAWSSPANGITATSYLDKTAKLGETYIYAVSAVNSSVTGSFRQTDAIKCNMTPTVSVANSENCIKVSWNAINGAESYTVFRRAYNDSTKTWGGWSKLKEGYTSTSYNDTLGNLGVTYSYTVVAVNSTLSSNYVSSVSIKCTPTLKPTIKNTTDGIKVEWSKIFGATSYKIFRRELDTSNNTWSGWASVTTGYTGNAFVDKTAKLGVTYSYAVVGVNSTTSSNYVATSGLKCDIPVTVKVTSTTSGINLSWNKVNGATGYTIYRKAFNATNNTWGSWSVLKTGYTGTSYTDTLGNLGASYIYCVRATVGSFSGSYVQSSSVKCNVVPKTTINNTTNGIKVSWSNVFGATSYKIFRRELNTTNNTWGSWAVVTSGLTSSAYVDKTSRLGVTYSYAVVAVNSTTSSSYIATSGLKCDPTPTVSVANTQTGVSVKWNAINGAESYIVYRRAYNDSTKEWSKWTSIKKDHKSTSYVDTMGNLGATYNYTVRAVANGEKGSYVSSVSIKCNIPPKVTIANSSTGVKVSWSNVFGATSYKVFRRELNTSTNTWSGWMSPASGLTGSAYIDTTAKLGVTYSYAVVAINSTDSSSYVATSGLKCNMAPTVKISSSTNGVKITWNAINGAGSYKIYRKELNTANNTWSGWMSPASGVTGTSYVDKTAKLGVTYIYTVAAVGNGITSNFVATSALKFDPIPTVTIGTATNGIRVNWNAINGADSYIIYKKTYNAKTEKWGTWTTVAQNYKGTTVVDTSAVNGTYYMYTVRATKGAFNSSFTQSNVVKYVK